MPADESRDNRDDEADEIRQSTFLNESDFPSSDDGNPGSETRRKHSGGKDTLSYGSDSLLGETVTLSAGDSNVLGNFRLISKLGSGGFGTVYKAEDMRLERMVAIKAALRKPADRGDDQYKRVFHEGRAAAALDHPNIVSIYDVAQLGGKPYIISQLIDGVTLKQWKSSGAISIQQIVKVLMLVARAVDYAHSKGVIHRDLKPGNILMDFEGVPYVNDFGIAKHSDADETISQESSIIGTPAYMSPEQAAGHSREADRRSDLYSMGVILYELLTGEKPFRGDSKMLIHHVIHTDPQPPRSLIQSVPRDLETICLKCLEKDPERRYQSCAELADELQRFLDGEPILARPISSFEHFLRRCRRYPATTAIAGGLIAAIVLGLIGVTWQWQRAEISRRQEADARVEAEVSRTKLADKVAYSNQMLHDAESKLAFGSMMAGDHRHAKQALDRLSELGDIEYRLIKNIEDRYDERLRHVELIRDLAISDDRRFVAAAGLRTLLVWETATGQIVFRYREKGQQLRCLDFQSGTNMLAWGGESGLLQLKAIDLADAKIRELDFGSPINAITFSTDGTKVLAAGDQGNLQCWTTSDLSNADSHQIVAGAINAADFVDNQTAVVGTADGQVLRCDLTTGQSQRLFQNRASILSVDISDDATTFAAGTRDSRILTGRLENPDVSQWIAVDGGPVVDLEFWGSKNALVSSSLFGRLQIWQLPDYGIRETHRYFQGAGHFAIDKNADQILIGGGDGAIVSFTVDAVRPDVIRTTQGGVRDLLFSESTLVVCHEQGPASVLHLETGQQLRTIPDQIELDNNPSSDFPSMTCVDGTPDHTKLVFGTADGRILVWNLTEGKSRLHGRPVDKAIANLQVTDDALLAVTGGVDGSVRVWDLSRADENESVAALGGVIRGLALAGDNRHAVAVSANGIAILVDVPSRQLQQRVDLKQPLHGAAWSADSSTIAIAGNRGTVFLFSSSLTNTPQQIEAHNGAVGQVLFSRSGNRITTFGNDEQVTFSNLVTGRSGATLQGILSASIRTLAVSTDGQWLASGDAAGEIRLWDVAGH